MADLNPGAALTRAKLAWDAAADIAHPNRMAGIARTSMITHPSDADALGMMGI